MTNSEFTPEPLAQPELTWPHVHSMQALSRPLSLLALLFGLAVFTGYLFSWEPLYRPIAGGPATHPLTATCIVLVATWLLLRKASGLVIGIRHLCVLMVLFITVSRLLETTPLSTLLQALTPFQDQVIADQQLGRSNSMGRNTAIMFLTIALSLMLFSFRHCRGAQLIASVAVAIPAISFTGYFYGLDQFYGQMSLITACAGAILAVSTLTLTADHGGLKAILSPHTGGVISRRQAVAGVGFPLVLGYASIRLLGESSGQLFGLFVVSICWFNLIMVSISARYQEAIDAQRRLLEAQLENAAYIDPLTDLWNRRKLFQFGLQETRRLQRRPGQYWFLMIDIDRFKNVNDTAGHEVGDLALVKLAQTIQGAIRAVDLASRMGGEEFGVVLVDCNNEGAERVAEGIRQAVALMNVEGWTALHGPITVSIGCAGNQGALSFEETIRRADAALYRAKNHGRNRVEFHV